MATSFFSWASCLVGKRSLSMTLIATSLSSVRCLPATQGHTITHLHTSTSQTFLTYTLLGDGLRSNFTNLHDFVLHFLKQWHFHPQYTDCMLFISGIFTSRDMFFLCNLDCISVPSSAVVTSCDTLYFVPGKLSFFVKRLATLDWLYLQIAIKI